MNKKGNLFMLGLMFAVFIFVGSIVLIDPLRVQTEQVRTALSCGTGGLTVYTEMTCIVVGSFLPIFALSAIGASLASIGIKKLVAE